MGNLKPGATYIHERVDNVVYAREFGADPSTRQVVGWDYDKDNPNFDRLRFLDACHYYEEYVVGE